MVLDIALLTGAQ